MAKKVVHSAARKRMTLAELSSFVADAYSSGATGGEDVAALVTLGGKLKQVSVDVITEPEHSAHNAPNTGTT